MCGIIAVLRRRSSRPSLDVAAAVSAAAEAAARIDEVPSSDEGIRLLHEVGATLGEIDRSLRGPDGCAALLADPTARTALAGVAERAEAGIARIEAGLEDPALSTRLLEEVSAALLTVKDATWALGRDRLRTVAAVAELAGSAPGPSAVAGYWAIQVALSAIDRLEVRGRDSAGLHVTVHDHGLDLDEPAMAKLLAERAGGLRFANLSVEVAGDALSFVYKAAAEIGELGDNTAALRAAIREDSLLRRALVAPEAEVTVLGHTRWASVGIISEPNAHPLNQREAESGERPYVAAALNGDVDNHADLKVTHRLSFPAEVTTDAKVIPALVARRLDEGDSVDEAFRTTVAGFEGSVAIAAEVPGSRDLLHLAQRGSGQGLYVGLAEDTFIVASEPYGVVELADRYIRVDGETPTDPDRPDTRGQVMVLDRSAAGEIAGIRRLSYAGDELPVSEHDLTHSEVTTRDIDRGDAPHYLLKELGEAPSSFRKTLRGRLVDVDGSTSVRLGVETMPAELVERIAAGEIRRVLVIGQGTAAVAGQTLARVLSTLAVDVDLDARAVAASELSGFGLETDMDDVLVVAISQSGTTTDTNRTVDLVRSRGASVIAVVNRRASDLVDRADGVLYTSDGRDVEMSVASTKAFYSQCAAGVLLGWAIAEAAGADLNGRRSLLEGLRQIPAALETVLADRDRIGQAAARYAPPKRYWAIVGNGPNVVTANEIRIKLSELCYKSIACDITEDKKHIDLSCEPMILVCAAGLFGSTADDVAKEVAIFRAHKATPIVIASDGEARYPAATELLTVPAVHPDLDAISAAMVGHLFGYEAALAIDASADPLRQLRSEIESGLASGTNSGALLTEVGTRVETHGGVFLDGMRTHRYDGHLEASTAVRLAALLRYAAGWVPLELYQVELGRVGTPAAVIEDLLAALGDAIDELTRPIDAIKHQAKTVTVGISRSDENLLAAPLVQAVLTAGASRDRLSYRTLRTLVGLDAAVAEVVGWTRYRIEGEASTGEALVSVVDRGGIARELTSRTGDDPRLRGTKRRAAEERQIWVAVGRSDGRTVINVPEVKGAQTTGLTLLHVRFHDRLPASTMRGVLQAVKDRYGALRDAVTETEPSFRDDVLATLPVVDLLTRPVYELASAWTEA